MIVLCVNQDSFVVSCYVFIVHVRMWEQVFSCTYKRPQFISPDKKTRDIFEKLRVNLLRYLSFVLEFVGRN